MPLFSSRPPAAQLAFGLVVPAIFGAICGVLLGTSATAFYGLQALGAVGGVLGGMEHTSASEGADRGLLGGLVFGSFLLLAHAIDGRAPQASLGEWPGMLILFASIAGALLGALGGAIRGNREVISEARADRVDDVRAQVTLLEAIILGAVLGLLLGVGIGAWRSRGDR